MDNIDEYEYQLGRLAAQSPHIMQYLLKQKEREQEEQQLRDYAPALLESLGIDNTGYSAPQQEQPDQLQSYQPQQAKNFGLYNDAIQSAAQQTGLTPEEIYMTIQKESGGNPNAASPTGPLGLMQLSKAAAIEGGISPDERLDPEKNIRAGANYLKQMKDQFGSDYRLAYHDGPTAVRNGQASPEGIAYKNSFAGVPIGNDGMPDASVPSLPPVAAASSFLPNRAVGGSGILGQDMDPVRRSYVHTIKNLLATGNPHAIQIAEKLYQELQQKSLDDIARTSNQKDLSMLQLDPNSDAYRNIALKMMLRPGNQTNINMSNNGDPFTALTPDQQIKLYGRLIPKDQPQPYVSNKTGEIKSPPNLSLSEDQNKSAQFATGLNSSLQAMLKLVETKDFNPTTNAKDFVGDTLESTGIPGVKSVGTNMQSEDQQLFNQAKREAETHIIHALSGSGFSDKEEQVKTLAYVPDWGNSAAVRKAKLHALSDQLNALVYRAGSAASPALIQAAKDATAQVEALEGTSSKTKDTKLPPLPELPPGHKWAD